MRRSEKDAGGDSANSAVRKREEIVLPSIPGSSGQNRTKTAPITWLQRYMPMPSCSRKIKVTLGVILPIPGRVLPTISIIANLPKGGRREA